MFKHYIILRRFTKQKNSVIKFFDDYSSLISETKHGSIHGKKLKILTPKQIP